MKGLIIIFLLAIQCLYGQVGVNTTDPQQTLHIGYQNGWWQPLGRMRVESLNAENNGYNGGDRDGNGNLANDLYPLYVDENGDFTLEFKPMINSADLDALNDTNLPTSTVYLPSTIPYGFQECEIVSYEITVSRSALLELKYNLSFDVYLNPAKDKITDNLSRFIETYVTVSGSSRKYAPATNNYSSGSVNSVAGTFQNSNTAYISLPSAGTYTLTFVGHVRSFIAWGANGGNPSSSTYVEFATGEDFVFFRLH